MEENVDRYFWKTVGKTRNSTNAEVDSASASESFVSVGLR